MRHQTKQTAVIKLRLGLAFGCGHVVAGWGSASADIDSNGRFIKGLISCLVGLFVGLLCCQAMPVQAEQKITVGFVDIHYIAFNSTFLQPEIARSLDIVRSVDRLVLNLSLRRNDAIGGAVAARVTGKVRNLLSQVRGLEFMEVKEDGAIYYIAQARFTDKEILRFNLEVLPDAYEQPVQIKFEQKFYAH